MVTNTEHTGHSFVHLLLQAAQTLALTNIFGTNRTGLVHDFARVVNELNGSLRETRMCRMGGIFSLLAMVGIH